MSIKSPGDAPRQEPAHCVLVVDDEDSINEEIVDWLELVGISTRSAPGAEPALAILAEDPAITVLLTDLHMPRLGGLALSRAARAVRSEEFAFEVVVLTGHSTVAHALDAGKAGVIDFLDKPVHLARLREAIDKAHLAAVGRRRAFQELARLTRDLDGSIDRLATALQAMVPPAPAPAGIAAPARAGGIPGACGEVLELLRLISRVGTGSTEAPVPRAPLLGAACRLAGYATALLQDAGGPAAMALPVALAALLRRATEVCAGLAAARAQQLRVECPADLRIRTDAAALEGLLHHLLAVTIHAAPVGGLIRLIAVPSGGEVRLAVLAGHDAQLCDTACGGACLARPPAEDGPAGGLAATLAARLGGRLSTCPAPARGRVLTLSMPGLAATANGAPGGWPA